MTKTLGTCADDTCTRKLVSRLDWAAMPLEDRPGFGQHEAGGLCRACYMRRQRRGIAVPTTRYLRANLLEDLGELLDHDPSLTYQTAAHRLGLRWRTLHTALRRAEKAEAPGATAIRDRLRRAAKAAA